MGNANKSSRGSNNINSLERKIKGKFILMSSAAVLIMMMILIGMIVLIAYIITYNRIYSQLDYLSDNGGKMPDYQARHVVDGVVITPESQYEFRYFSVVICNDEEDSVDVSHIAAISKERASELAREVMKNKRGTISENDSTYVYKVVDMGENGKMILFLDSTRTLDNVWEIIKLSLLIGLLSFMVFFLIISALSGKVVKSTVKNIKAQNEFITNAGHELKTPLAIISANTEVLEMMNGKNEWTESIINQVKRMSGLISDLIFLAKMNEKTDIVLSDIDFSKITNDITMSFKPVIEQQNKKLSCDIKEDVIIKGEEKMLSELVSILVDNAAKYCDDGGSVRVELKNKSRDAGARFVVSNTYEEGKNVDYARFFNRFYREDTSHNSKKKGYGIGLSMAEGIVKTLKGKISVSYNNATGEISFVVTL